MSQVIIIVACIGLNACLSAFEMSLVSVRRASLRLLVDGGSKQAKELLAMRENLEKTLSTIQVGITIVAIISGAMASELTEQFGAPILLNLGVSAKWSEPLSTAIFVILITFVTVVFGELVPKSLAARHPSKVAFFFMRTIRTLNRVFSPFVRVLEKTTLASLKWLQWIGFESSRKDLQEVDDAFAIEKLSKKHREYVYNLVKLQEIVLEDVMLEWSLVTKIDTSMSDQEVQSVIVESGHTRIPVVENGEIKGLLNSKQFLAATTKPWQMLVRPILQVNESSKPLSALRKMQSKRSHMCVVVSNETMQPLGIVTIEDILEEVVGDIFDEDDDD